MSGKTIYTITYTEGDSCWDCGERLDDRYCIIVATFTNKDSAWSKLEELRKYQGGNINDNWKYNIIEYEEGEILPHLY